MAKREEISINDIEKAVDVAGGTFSVAEIAKKCGNVSAATRNRIYRILDGDDRFFSEKEVWVRRDHFFKRRRFLITPDEWEISEGILVPGHRFVPFAAPEVFASEVVLRLAQSLVPQKCVTAPLGKIFHYHLLLGSEQLFDFLIADSRANAHLKKSRSGNEPVTLTVFDLAQFYRDHDFALGDALILTTEDFSKGIFDVEFLPAGSRPAAKREKAVAALDAAIVKVFDRFEEYLDIPEQIAWGIFLAGETLPEAAASLDEYIRDSQGLTIHTEGGHAVLVPLSRINEESENDDAVPDFVTLSSGDTTSVGAILKSIGSTFTPVEMEAFILDACYGRVADFGVFFQHFFGNACFADEAQKEIFKTMLEEHFEEHLETYNRADDEAKAPVRRDILDAVEERQAFFDFLAESGKDPSAIEKKLLTGCAAISHRFAETLKMLDDPSYTPDAAELEELANAVAIELEKFDAIMDQLNSQIERNKE